MEVIAKTGNDGFLIQATGAELKEIINSINGKKPENIEIGQKIPAIDYAATITKVKGIKDDYYYKELLKEWGRLSVTIADFSKSVDNAVNIQV